MKRVLLTGAAGRVGKYAIGALSRRGIEVVATDVVSKGVPEGVRFERCDLTDADAVGRMMALVKPDVVGQGAAVVAPIAYAEPALAEAVNLGGTRHLIDATKRHVPDAFFAFLSSYAAFGPACPNAPSRAATDEPRPVDNYGSQKLTAEAWLRDSGLRQCSLRIGGVLSIEHLLPKHPSYMPFVFMVALDQPEHGVDARDVARAVASVAAKEPDGELFLIAGDDSWKDTARALRRDVFDAIGLPTPPERAFRSGADPDAPEGWFYECWMDAAKSERELSFQRTSRRAFMMELRQRRMFRRLSLTPLRPAIGHAMRRASPYLGRGKIKPGPTIWDDICRVYGVPRTLAPGHRPKRLGAAPPRLVR